MNAKERAVIEAAKDVFGMRTVDTDTGQFWRHRAVCSWNTDRLYRAVLALEVTQDKHRMPRDFR